MPLLKGKFRPATKVARSRTNSTSEGERSRSNSFSEFDAQKRLPFHSVRTAGNTTLFPSQFSAFKVPASPIIVGLVSPRKQSTLYHASPRKTPTTPFSPRRPVSPHFIPTPPGLLETYHRKPEFEELESQMIKEAEPKSDTEEKVEEDLFVPDPLEDIITAVDKDSSGSEYNDSDAQSDSGYSSSRKMKLHPVPIDKSVMTIADVIKLRVPKNPDNPLTKIWSDLRDKEKRDKELNLAKEQTKKDRIQQLIEEAKSMGEIITENDIDENELPPIEVEVDPETGKIVVNEKSLEVKMKSETDIQETVEEDDAEITYGKYEDHKVSIKSYSRRKQRKSVQWTQNENSRFYLALRKVGTDFDLMQKTMPEYTRDQLKRKFKREEKLRLSKIDLALSYSMRLNDELLEKESSPPPQSPVPKPKPKRKPTKRSRKPAKEDLTNVIIERLSNETHEKTMALQRPIAHVLSDSDGEYVPKKRPAHKRQSRPLVIDDSESIVIVRDASLDRKLLL